MDITWPYGWEHLMVSDYPVKFDGDKHWGVGDIIVLVCHVISENHVLNGSCDFMG